MTKSGFDLDEIERLLAAATVGEWIACGWGDGSTPDGLTNIFNHDAEVLLMECLPVDDAALIVALHNSAPAMIAAIRELRAENARLREMTATNRQAWDNALELGIIPKRYRNTVRIMSDGCRAALGEPQ